MVTLTIPALADTFTEQAEQLSQLRMEVTSLASRLKEEQGFFQNRLRSLETQRSDLELQIRREKTQLETVQQQIVDLESQLQPSEQEDLLATEVRTASDKLKNSIGLSLPYRHADRIQAIDELLSQMEHKKISPQQAATRLWAVSEDEKRLNQENILDKQNIEIDGNSVLVDIVRLGMVAMYYQTPNGNVGYVTQQKNRWVWISIDDPEQRKQVQELFLNLKKGIRTGHYTLPYAVVSP